MQTFLPYPKLLDSLLALDKKRLGKQRVETWQIINLLLFPHGKKAWINHPAVLMWKGYEDALIRYYNLSLEVFELRGGHNIKLQPIHTNLRKITLPPWFRNEKIFASHRSNLLRKDWKFYSQYNWKEPDNLEYFWPMRKI